MSERRRVVIYARYSSDNQREESIEGQLRECQDFIRDKGLVLVGTLSTGLFRPGRMTDPISRG